MDIVLHKLGLCSPLREDEKAALRRVFSMTRVLEPEQDLFAEGDRPALVGAVLEGLLRRHKVLPDGQRQILAFPVPGDIFDLHSFLLDSMDHSVTALTRSTVLTASPAAMEALAAEHPRLNVLLCRSATVEAAVSREWIVNTGRRTAYSRMAHLFCEIFARMDDVELTSGSSCALPLTQATLADATGLSVVHVNRVLQQLRREKLISLRGGMLTIHDWDQLTAAASFNGAYLHSPNTRGRGRELSSRGARGGIGGRRDSRDARQAHS